MSTSLPISPQLASFFSNPHNKASFQGFYQLQLTISAEVLREIPFTPQCNLHPALNWLIAF